jgi:hypothetical protein
MILKPYFKLDNGYEFVEHSMNIDVASETPNISFLMEKYYRNMMLAASNEIAYLGSGTIVEYTLVEETMGAWIYGVYYAHEYDRFVRGRGRRYSYGNGYAIYEIECLDKKLRVADGFWEEPSGNGSGDTFQTEEEL